MASTRPACVGDPVTSGVEMPLPGCPTALTLDCDASSVHAAPLHKDKAVLADPLGARHRM